MAANLEALDRQLEARLSIAPQVWLREHTAFACASAAVLPKTDAFACVFTAVLSKTDAFARGAAAATGRDGLLHTRGWWGGAAGARAHATGLGGATLPFIDPPLPCPLLSTAFP